MDSGALNYSTSAIESLERTVSGLRRSGFVRTAQVHEQLARLMRDAVKFNLPDHGDLVALETLDESFSDFIRLPFDAVCLETPFTKVEEVYTGDFQFAEHASSRRISVCWTSAAAQRYPGLTPSGGPKGGFYVASVYYDDADKMWVLCPVANYIPDSPEIKRGAAPPTSPAETLEREFLLKRGAIKATNSTYECMTVRLCPEMVLLMATQLDSEDAAMARLTLDVRDETRTAFGFCLTVNASNVGRERLSAPAKLNKKRLANGRVPFFDSWVLDLKGSGSTSYGTSADIPQGLRAGPRMHLRRGHIRRLGPDRITFVRATAVGSARQGVIDKQYRVVPPGNA